MDTEKIIQDLNRRFAEPLPEFYKRRIIFWYDEDQEFADKLDDIQISNAKMVVLTGTNNFEVKKLLNVDDTTSNYLVYSPFSYDNQEDNWFLDIELYSEEFRSDLISMWMDELDNDSNPVFQDFVTYDVHSAFWNMVSQGSGYQDAEPSLQNLARHLLLTASTRTMRQEFLKGLEGYISSAYQAYCYDFVSDWMHGRDSEVIFDIASKVEEDLELPQRFNNSKSMQIEDFLESLLVIKYSNF